MTTYTYPLHPRHPVSNVWVDPALELARAVRARVRAQSRATASETVTSRRKRRSGTMSRLPARYVGPFRRPRRNVGAGPYAKYGTVDQAEVFGANTMQDCNYMGFTTVVPYSVAQDVGIAVLRYIMKKHYEREYSSVDALVCGDYQATKTEPQEIRFWGNLRWQQTGILTDSMTSIAKFTFDNTTTLRSFGQWFCENVFFNEKAGGTIGSNGIYRLKAYSLIGEEGEGDSGVPKYHYIDTMRVHVFCKTIVKIQNTTLSDAGSAAVDVNNANPIRGTLFKFKGLNPRIRDVPDGQNFKELQFSDGATRDTKDGVMYPSVDPPVGWRIVPKPSAFENCRKTTSVFLNPGQIRSLVLRFSFHGTIQSLIDGLTVGDASFNPATGTFGSVPAHRHGQLGMMYLFAFEQVLRTGTQAIILNYQCDRITGAYVTPPKRQLCKRWTRYISEVNNDPA